MTQNLGCNHAVGRSIQVTAGDGELASTVIVADASDNVRHPPEWFVRSEDFAAVCPAPFFSEELPFTAGETLRLRSAVLVADGLADDERATRLAAQAQKALATG